MTSFSTRYCISVWTSALEQCRQDLNDQDYHTIFQYQNYVAMWESGRSAGTTHNSGDIPILFQRIERSFGSTRKFIAILRSGPSTSCIDTSLYWGLLGLVIGVSLSLITVQRLKYPQLTLKNTSILSSITNMLEDIAHNLDLLQSYGFICHREPLLESTFVDAFVDVISFWARTIRFLQRTTQNEKPKGSLRAGLMSIKISFKLKRKTCRAFRG